MDGDSARIEEHPILTPDRRLRVFVSSTLSELAHERRSVRDAIERLRLIPVLFEMGARPHPPRALYRAYLDQSHVFVGIYGQSYGWVAPDMSVSGIEDEYLSSRGKPTLLYVATPAPDRDPRLSALIERIEADGRASYRPFTTAEELGRFVADDLALLLTERFESGPGRASSPLGSVRPRPLPVPTSPIVGRDEEIAALTDALRRQDVRLVSLTGPGGVGKTRLALAVADRATPAYADGVFFVDLQAIDDAADVPAAIASAIGMTYDRSRDLADAVLEILAPTSVLLVLDNFEQVAEAAPFVASLLSTCPGVKVLATSRTRLRLRGEHAAPTAPLALPTAEPSLDQAVASPAVRLFEQRAKQAKPGFTITPDNAAAIADVCIRLDGLPLAIELVAPAIRILPAGALAERVRDRVSLFVGDVDLPERQRTLMATLDWSHGLLDARERRALARLSVFVGGFTLEAAEAVCADQDEPDVLQRLASLVDKSLVVPEEDTAGRPRFRLLETVRAYAEEKLRERGQSEDALRRHQAYFVDFSRTAGHGIRNESERAWYLRIAADDPNIAAAAARAGERGDVSTLFEIVTSLWIYFQMTNQNADKASFVEDLYADGPPLPDDARAGLAFAVGGLRLARRGVDLAEAIPPLTEAVALWRRSGRRVHEADAEVYLGFATAPDRTHFDRASALYEDLGDAWGMAWVQYALGMTALVAGTSEAAGARLEEALRLARGIESAWLAGAALSTMGLVAMADDRDEDARTSLTEATGLLLGVYDREGLADCLYGFGALALDDGEAEEAAVLIGAADAIRERAGYFSSIKAMPAIRAIPSDVRAALGEDAFREACAVGARLGAREAVVRAMDRFGTRSAIAANHAGDTPTSANPQRRP